MLGIYEGIGRILGIATYILIFLFALSGSLIFWYKKKRPWAFWWVSVMVNIFAYLYFLGDSSLIGWIIRVYSIIAWPIINIAWLMDLVRGVRRGKGKKK